MGEKSLFPVRTGEKLQRESFWCRQVKFAAEECRFAGLIVRVLNENQAARITHKRRVSFKLWDTAVEATQHRLPEGFIQITDWEQQCAGLSAPITLKNAPDWWCVIKEF